MTGIFSSAAHDAACPPSGGQLTTSSLALTAPGAPGNLTFSVNSNTVTFSWTGSTSGDAATSYVIEAGSSPGASDIAVFDTGTSGREFTSTSVPAGTYYVRVRARNSAGTSGPSNEVVVTVGSTTGCTSAPGAPTGLASAVTGRTVTLSWTAPGGACPASSYVLQAGSSSGLSNLANFNTGSAATRYVATDVPEGTYFARVLAANSVGNGAASSEIVIVVGSTGTGTVTGRWIGLVANGDGTVLNSSDCGLEKADWQLDLTQTGSDVTGTLTQTTVMSGCDPVGLVRVAPLTGTAGSGTFSFSLSPSRRANATFTATRMTGSTDFAGTFALNRQ